MTTEAHRSFARALARLLPSRPALVAVLLGGAAMGSTAGAFAGEPASRPAPTDTATPSPDLLELARYLDLLENLDLLSQLEMLELMPLLEDNDER